MKSLLFFLILAASWTTLTPEGDWELVFEDNFEGNTLDLEKWGTCYFSVDPGEGCKLYDNGELEWYVPENVIVEDSMLKLRAERRKVNGYDYASGMISGHDTFVFQYGYMEMRAKLPSGRGLWPAFWTMPDDRKWPPEIDIMENLGHEPRQIYFGLHFGPRSKPEARVRRFTGPNFSKDFHVFSALWEENLLVWYVDGEEQWRMTDDVPAEPMYLIANLAVGGRWPGNPNDETPFPSEYQIDYIRVWQRAEG